MADRPIITTYAPVAITENILANIAYKVKGNYERAE